MSVKNIIPKDFFTSKEMVSKSIFIDRIASTLGSKLVKQIESHNTDSVIFVCQYNKCKFIIKAELGSKTATHKEIEWYSYTSKHHPSSFSPKYYGAYVGESYAMLFIEYISNSLTIDEIVYEEKIESNSVINMLTSFIKANERMFTKTCRRVSRDHVKQLFAEKYRSRKLEAEQYMYLKSLLNNDRLLINYQPYYSPNYLFKKINEHEHLSNYVNSQKIGMIHGDLHCGNMLVTGKKLSWVDPNGCFELPLEYDLGKLLHSVHGNYGSIIRGKYLISHISLGEYHFSYFEPEVYKNAQKIIRQQLTNREYAQALYAEAMHFATMLPHHASEQQETVALYLRCTQLFNELWLFLTSLKNT